MDEKGPFFQTLRRLVDAINKHKIFSPATINYGDPDIINTLAAETHTFGLAPRYDIPGVNVEGTKVWTDLKGVRQVRPSVRLRSRRIPIVLYAGGELTGDEKRMA